MLSGTARATPRTLRSASLLLLVCRAPPPAPMVHRRRAGESPLQYCYTLPSIYSYFPSLYYASLPVAQAPPIKGGAPLRGR